MAILSGFTVRPFLCTIHQQCSVGTFCSPSDTCISLLSCSVLLQSANQDATAKKFVEDSACLGGQFQGCCGKSGKYSQKLNKPSQIEKPINESSRDYVLRNKLLPDKKYCGLQHTDDYFYNETATSVDEFPCQFGINHTVQMILGQHHIYMDVSCIPTRYDIDDCTRPIQRVVSYGWYTAPSKHWDSITSANGIGMLRLHKPIEFSDYVRPICFHLEEGDSPKPGDVVFTSGWGEQESVDGKTVKLKKRIKHIVMDQEECENGNEVLNPVCGLAFENNTHYVCPGDNGGPLMFKRNNNWIVTAMVTGITTCDDVHPLIAEKITAPDTINWIFDAMVLIEEKAKSGYVGGIV